MKLKKAWTYEVDTQTHVTVLDGSNHPADLMFLRWAKNLPRKRVFILTVKAF